MAEAGPKNDREPARHQVHRVASSVLNLIPDNESAPEWIYLGVWSAEHERFVMLRTKKTSSIARVKMDVIDALNCSKGHLATVDDCDADRMSLENGEGKSSKDNEAIRRKAKSARPPSRQQSLEQGLVNRCDASEVSHFVLRTSAGGRLDDRSHSNIGNACCAPFDMLSFQREGMYSPFPAVRSWPQVNFGMSLYVLEQTSPVALNIDGWPETEIRGRWHPCRLQIHSNRLSIYREGHSYPVKHSKVQGVNLPPLTSNILQSHHVLADFPSKSSHVLLLSLASLKEPVILRCRDDVGFHDLLRVLGPQSLLSDAAWAQAEWKYRRAALRLAERSSLGLPVNVSDLPSQPRSPSHLSDGGFSCTGDDDSVSHAQPFASLAMLPSATIPTSISCSSKSPDETPKKHSSDPSKHKRNATEAHPRPRLTNAKHVTVQSDTSVPRLRQHVIRRTPSYHQSVRSPATAVSFSPPLLAIPQPRRCRSFTTPSMSEHDRLYAVRSLLEDAIVSDSTSAFDDDVSSEA